ncbi:MAG TPA: ABC transporter ATP-binding protein [Candidatus Caccalectryoclostridium excrementigallinarum]|uniref:ABC transporter ATP-binding protein n=1 Tax=Candidatus Caccalectryoclostridium excrementigallinarum TaxID=2840710 RepID=A0A9D1MM68_9FIRM|nr:ABC transporter ATP-binding protein [Candidatus Caccalectryoclostridium excrementigallinarum]
MTSFFAPYKKELIVGPFCKLVEAVLELLIPLIMAEIIDKGIALADWKFVLKYSGLIVLACTSGLCFSLVCQIFASRCSQGYGTDVRNALFKHINSLSSEQFDDFGTPSLLTRLSGDINQLQVAVAMLIRLVVRAPFIIIGSVVMAIILNPRLSLVFIAATPVIALALFFIMRSTVPRYKKVQKKVDDLSKVTRENLTGVRVVRAFAKEEEERERFNGEAKELAKAASVVGAISALLNPVSLLIINLAITAVVYFGGDMVNTGDMTQGEVTAFVNYLTQISLALVVTANLVVIFTKASASGARVKEVLNTSPSVTDGEGVEWGEDGAPRVEFKHVFFGYGGNDVLQDISFKIYPSKVVGVIGGTGSGKSTLVNLLPRFYDVRRGSVLINGRNVKDYKLKQLRDRIGYVPQRTVLFSGTIRENMLWGNPGATDEDIMQALRTAQAEEFVAKLPEGLDTQVNQGGKNFSGGQRQRLTIARALVRRPEIVIMDDSASALDFATDLKLRTAIRHNLTDTTTFIVSQRATSVRHADLIIVLDGGVAVGMGRHDELMRTCEVYREIVQSQEDKEGRHDD